MQELKDKAKEKDKEKEKFVKAKRKMIVEEKHCSKEK